MANRQKWCVALLIAAVFTSCIAPEKEHSAFLFNILDENDAPTASRVRITDLQGNYLAPLGHSTDFAMTTSMDQEPVETDVLLDDQRRFAYVNGEFQLQTAEETVRIEVVKGFNYRIFDDTLTLNQIDEAHKISLRPAFDNLPDESWYSGDVHVHHINTESALLEMKAEDLNVCNLLISDFTLDHHNFKGSIESESEPEHLIFYGQEYREDRLGHINLLNLTKNLIEPAKKQRQHQYPLNMEAMDQAHQQSGHVSWAHFAAWPGLEGPLAVVMKKVDAVELLCTIDPFHEPIFVSDVVPEVRMNSGLKLWYRLLNCGFKIPITGGTDKMGNFVTVGANRTYAQVAGTFSYEKWIEALNRGRTFVSNSPFLTFKVNDQGPGSSMRVSTGNTLHISAQVWSQMPIDRLEIVANGELVAEVTLDPGQQYQSIEIPYQADRSAWLAARAYQLTEIQTRQGLSLSQRRNQGGGPTQLNKYYGTLRPEVTFAHTSPVYIEVDGQAIRSSSDAQYFVQYLNNAIRWLNQEGSFPSEEARQKVLAAFKEGRRRFMEL